MKRAPRWVVCLGLLAFVLAARADDFWKRKPPQEWTADEAVRILRDSPWARKESVAESPVDCESKEYDDFGNCRVPPSPSPLGREQRRGQGLPDQGFNVAIYLVRWDSAPEVAAAFARLASLGERVLATFHSPPPRRPPDRYVITMSVIQPAKEVGDPFKERENSKEGMPVRLKTSRGTFAPLESERSGVGANEAIHFFFPRELDGRPVLDPKGDTAEFTFEGAKISLKSKFTLDAEPLR